MKFNYENLEISKLSLELIDIVYNLTNKFPKEEMFGLGSQLKRSASSVLLNIAEGSGKYSKQDFARYIRNAIGSLIETHAGIKIVQKRKYISETEQKNIKQIIEKLFYKLIAFEKSLIGKRRKC